MYREEIVCLIDAMMTRYGDLVADIKIYSFLQQGTGCVDLTFFAQDMKYSVALNIQKAEIVISFSRLYTRSNAVVNPNRQWMRER